MLDALNPCQSLCDEPFKKTFDFEVCSIEELKSIDMVFQSTISKSAILNGYAIYFDAYFTGAEHRVILRTGPEHPVTHWYQTRLFLPEPIGVNKN